MSTSGIEISVVSPVYNAEEIVLELVERINEAVIDLTDRYEIILVEDGSEDESWEMISRECSKNSKVKGIKLSRNFGQHYAVTAGVKEASGQVIILMDCDLQDDPANIGMLVNEIKDGYDIVFTKRKKRQHSFYKLLTARIFNWLFKFFSDSNYDVNVGSLTAFTYKVGREFLKLGEHDRLYIQILKWLGFKNKFIEVEHKKRHSGESTYSFSKLLVIAIQGWTSHSDKLLRSSIYLGFALGVISFIAIIVIIILYFVQGFQPGWPSVIVAILFSTGLILMTLGITGIYIGKVFQQVKNRPLYVVQTFMNFSNAKEENNPRG